MFEPLERRVSARDLHCIILQYQGLLQVHALRPPPSTKAFRKKLNMRNRIRQVPVRAHRNRQAGATFYNRTMIRRFLLTLLLVLPLVTACTSDAQGSDDLPRAEQLLVSAAQNMRKVSTARFEINVRGGSVGGFAIQGARGQLTRAGEAKGTVRVNRLGRLVELRFVVVNGNIYVRGPTGGFQQLPAAFASSVYDPSIILDPQSGVAALLSQASNATTVGRETIEGVEAYRVQATFPGQLLDDLIPGLSSDTRGTVWISVQQKRLVRARFPLPNGGSVTVRLFGFNAPANISPPAVTPR